jgi:trans-feruloyl-CoA hydratase/vanillin synthase
MTGRTFDGRKAAEMKFVNASVPLKDLESVTLATANEIAGKDAAALRACKEGYRHSLDMNWDASVSYTEALEDEVFMAQKGGWIEKGVGDFVKGKYKPGLQSNEVVSD